MTKEQVLVDKIKAWCAKTGAIYYKNCSCGRIGRPDIEIFLKGQVYIIETKKPDGKAGYFQARQIKDLQEQGFKASFIFTLEEFINFIQG